MTREFLTVLAPYVIEGKEFVPHLIVFADAWPKDIESTNEYDFKETDKLKADNIGLVSHTDESITICCHGAEQAPHLVTLIVIEGKLTVESAHTTPQFIRRIDNEQWELMFNGIDVGLRPEKVQPRWWYQQRIKDCIDREDYATAARLRDEVNQLIKEGKL